MRDRHRKQGRNSQFATGKNFWEGVESRIICEPGDPEKKGRVATIHGVWKWQIFIKKEEVRCMVRFSKKLLAVLFLVTAVLAFSIVLIDDAGRLVNIPVIPQRVVSASPNASRYIKILGLEKRVVGVTSWDSVIKAENIGNLVPLNVEKIYSLKPDLVFVFGGFQLPEVEKLEKAKLTAFVLNPTTLNDIVRATAKISAIFNLKDKGDKIVKSLNDKIVQMGQKTSKIPLNQRPTVFYTISVPDENTKELWTAGTGSYINDLIVIAGGKNITAGYSGNNGWLPVNFEFVVQNDPDIIIVGGYGDPKQIEQVFKNHPILKNLKAVKNNKVFVFDGDELSQPAPQIIDYLEVFYKVFYGGK